MILVDPDDLAAHPTRDLAQLAFLIGRGLIDRTDPEIDNRSSAARARPLRLPLTTDVFDARLDRFLAMSSLPFLNRRRDTISKAKLAMMAASRLSLVRWRYRGQLDHSR